MRKIGCYVWARNRKSGREVDAVEQEIERRALCPAILGFNDWLMTKPAQLHRVRMKTPQIEKVRTRTRMTSRWSNTRRPWKKGQLHVHLNCGSHISVADTSSQVFQPRSCCECVLYDILPSSSLSSSYDISSRIGLVLSISARSNKMSTPTGDQGLENGS